MPDSSLNKTVYAILFGKLDENQGRKVERLRCSSYARLAASCFTEISWSDLQPFLFPEVKGFCFPQYI